jgi:hypothetical protein
MLTRAAYAARVSQKSGKDTKGHRVMAQGGRGTNGNGQRLGAIAVLALAAVAIFASTASAAAPIVANTDVSAVTASAATLEASINPQSKLTRYHFEYGPEDCAANPCASVPVPEGEVPAGSSPVTVKATVEGLSPATIYHFRVVTKNGATPADEAKSPDRIFATFSAPLSGLPDNRAYEQASPIDKDGGDVIGTVPQLKTPPQGGAITYSSTDGAPGGVGAQDLPLYLASRSPSGWSSQGLLPPATSGEQAHVLGWLPDFSKVFSSAFKIGEPSTGALLAMPGSGPQVPEELVPPTPNAGYAFVGSGDNEVVFESRASLGSPAGIEGASNVYAWDRESGEVSLVSVLNDGEPLANGAFGGSYDWALGMTPTNLSQGGAARNYYTQDQNAVTDQGAVFFTEAKTGQLYMRVNPTQPQSALDAGKCTEADKACTYHVSESQLSPPDPAGPRPAAFMGAAADGSSAFFTSPEKLTEDANTGPTQPKPQIGRADIDGVTDVEPDWLEDHRAVGVAVDDEFIYWASPAEGTIGRAKLDGSDANDEFISPGPTTVEEEIEIGPDEFETITKVVPSSPRYVAVNENRIYWTNMADGKNSHGSIGRADIDGTPASVEPECIKGASNPQGIALNATHAYWANAGNAGKITIGRAEIDCGAAVQDFQKVLIGAEVPQGVALSTTNLYWTAVEASGDSYLERAPLDGTSSPNISFLGNAAQPRGLAAQGEDLYWAAQGDKAVGHAVWPDANTAPTTVEKEFIKLNGAPSGVAADAEHIYWSTDGERVPSPGNDLYRFVPGGDGKGSLEDLTPEPGTGNGAEVQGVVGVSEDGSHVYYVANADFDGPGPAQMGNCTGPLRLAKGQCNLYVWREGDGIGFAARLSASGSTLESDAANWVPTTSGIFAGSDPQKTAFVSADGQTLLFRSQQQLTDYDNGGVSELYRYREGQPIICVSCNPAGQAPQHAPLGLTLGSLKPSALRVTEPAILASRTLSADGNRTFFETTEALVASDTNGQAGCPAVGSLLQRFPACRDVYEWEAPGSGSCEEFGPAYSPLNGGCLYLISSGKDDYPSFFADASEDGKDVFFFTRESLVGQDKDELLDVYDARVDGGLTSQNPEPGVPCESAEACHGPIPPAPPEGQPSTQTFVGPGNAVSKPHHKKPRKHRKHKKHVKKKHQKHRGANSERRAGT